MRNIDESQLWLYEKKGVATEWIGANACRGKERESSRIDYYDFHKNIFSIKRCFS
ncbi:hypothetical protein [Bacillus marinisedimentorum]|uniref:hypothetical protein n=1 Tax=Bacillus marinisedimentorum TaxID=1821260 RepID=UPI000A75BAC2|nr:hypothetical protein [Bacillus marinisedimentorum]